MNQVRQRQTCSRSSHWCGCWPTRAGAAGLRVGPRGVGPQRGPGSLWRRRSRLGGAHGALSRRSTTTRSTTSTHSCTVLLLLLAPCTRHACAMHVPCIRHACAIHTPRTSRFDTRHVCTLPLPPQARRPSTSSRPHGSRRDSTSTRTPTRSRTSHVYLTPPPSPPLQPQH